ncbi:MAG: YbjN domain-containing protein [Desulfatibacillum sp.]|nr:YbjN domain-containing protein [Desulfatibacillum sp.]
MTGSWNHIRTRDFLEDLGLTIVKEDESRGLIVASDEANSIVNMVFDCVAEVLIMQQIVSVVPENNTEAFFKRVLQINREILYGGFAIDANSRVLLFRATHPFDRLTKHMIEASLRGLEHAMGLFGTELARFHGPLG